MWLPIGVIALAGSAVLIGGAKTYLRGKKNLAWKLTRHLPASSPATPGQPLPEAQEVEHYLTASSVGLGFTLATQFAYPPLGLFVTPLIVYVNWPTFMSAWADFRRRRTIKLDGLMTLFIIGAWISGAYSVSFFSLLTYLFAQRLTLNTQDRSRRELIHLFDQQPRMVWRWVDGVELETPFQQIQVGDTVVIHAGVLIPVDGRVIAGMATVDQHRLTGESLPVEKTVGDAVFSASLALSGSLQVLVEKTGNETLAMRIAEILRNTTSYHLAIEERGRMLAEKTVLPILLLSGLAWPLLGFGSAIALLYAMPGVDMIFAGPLALLNFLHLSTRNGVLVKDGRSLELLHLTDTVVFDKTGTLTLEQLEIVEIHLCGALAANELLTYAAAAEYRQTHPVAVAILAAAAERNLAVPDVAETRCELGFGVLVNLAGRQVRVGSGRFMANQGLVPTSTLGGIQEKCIEFGHSLVFVAVDDKLVGALELRSTLRPEALSVITALKARGMHIAILSGDHLEPTRHLAERLGIDRYFAEALPEDKARYIQDLQQAGGSVCFVGDGVNDAIALKTAHVSISLRGATTLATDAAQIVLMDQNLRQLPMLFDMAQSLERNLLTSFGLSISAGGIMVGSIFCLHAQMASVVWIGSVGLLGVVGNAMLPLLGTLKNTAVLENETPAGCLSPADSLKQPPDENRPR
jgi:Cu2+-exporting ATPase